MKKLDLKSIFILILAIAVLISFYVGQKSNIDYKKNELKQLNNINDSLAKEIKKINGKNLLLFKSIEINKELLKENEIKIIKSERKIDSLIHEKNKIYSNVYRMSANDVSRSFTEYLNKRIESKHSSY